MRGEQLVGRLLAVVETLRLATHLEDVAGGDAVRRPLSMNTTICGRLEVLAAGPPRYFAAHAVAHTHRMRRLPAGVNFSAGKRRLPGTDRAVHRHDARQVPPGDVSVMRARPVGRITSP